MVNMRPFNQFEQKNLHQRLGQYEGQMESLGDRAAMEQELTVYSEEVNEGLSEVTSRSMKKLVKKTQATAPTGKRHGQFRDNITADYTQLRRRGGGNFFGGEGGVDG